MRYIIYRRFKGPCLCGTVNLPYGTVCESDGELILHDSDPLVVTTSENAHQYFARDDDGKGRERGTLIRQILGMLRCPENETKGQYKKRMAAWERIWNDPKLQPYRMREHADHWLWNHAFFNAEIKTLEYILSVVKGG